MTCREFDHLLDRLLDGSCPSADWERAERHRAACARCRRLVEALGGGAGVLDEASHAALTAAILARTSGTTCRAARDRLCALVDGELSTLDRELVEGHLAACEACSALAGALKQTSRVLPGFAEIRPPETFVQQVLAATSRQMVEPSLGERVTAWLLGAARRPQFSLEVAYVCTLLLVLLFGNPVKAFRETAALGTVYVRPHAELAVERVVVTIDSICSRSARAISQLTSASRPSQSSTGQWRAAVTAVARWVTMAVGETLHALIERALQWIRAVRDKIGGWLGIATGAQTPAECGAAGSVGRGEPSSFPARSRE